MDVLPLSLPTLLLVLLAALVLVLSNATALLLGSFSTAKGTFELWNVRAKLNFIHG